MKARWLILMKNNQIRWRLHSFDFASALGLCVSDKGKGVQCSLAVEGESP